MHTLVMSTPPPNMDSFTPEFCFCGKRTVESHEFWFCSTDCARLDSLRSLDDPECHYRDVVRRAYAQAGIPLSPRRVVSADHLRPGPCRQRTLANLPPRLPPPTNPPCRAPACGEVRDQNMAGFPTLSQVTGKILTNKAKGGEPLVTPRQDRPKWEGLPKARPRVRLAVKPDEDHIIQQISLDVIPLPEPDPVHRLRRVPEARDGLKNSIRKSVAALLNVGRSRRGTGGENPEKVFGHPVNVVVPPAREESLPSHRQKGLPATPAQKPKDLRRSTSFAGWDAPPHSSTHGYDVILQLIEEMTEEAGARDFDPGSLFNVGGP